MAGERVFIGLGSNLGDPVRQVRQAMEEIASLSLVTSLARSSLYRSAPVGLTEQPDFINAVVRVSTAREPADLLQALQRIEHTQGRVRRERDGPRTLDLDLLLYDDLILNEGNVRLPHPRMHERAFVLLPLAEIAHGVIIPGQGAVEHLLGKLSKQAVKRIDVA